MSWREGVLPVWPLGSLPEHQQSWERAFECPKQEGHFTCIFIVATSKLCAEVQGLQKPCISSSQLKLQGVVTYASLLNSSQTAPTSSLEGDQMIEMCTLFTPPLHTHSQPLLLPLAYTSHQHTYTHSHTIIYILSIQMPSGLGQETHVCILSLAFPSFLTFRVWIELLKVNLAHIPVMSVLIPTPALPPMAWMCTGWLQWHLWQVRSFKPTWSGNMVRLEDPLA